MSNVEARSSAVRFLPVAPLAEQHRIVAEIEKQFTRLDAAVAALERGAGEPQALPRVGAQGGVRGAARADGGD